MIDSGTARSSTAPLFSDTSPNAEEVLIGLLRQAPPWRKLHVVGQLNETVRTLVLSGLRARPPDASSQEMRRCLADPRRWAATLAVGGLLEQALVQAGLSEMPR